MHKRFLILEACGNSDEPHENNRICEHAKLYNFANKKLVGQ